MDTYKGLVLFLCQLSCVVHNSCAQLVGARGAAPTVPAPVCTAPGIAVYSATLETFWSKILFPKQYPLYRPHAQWSKVIGRTHDSSYSIWRNDSIASPAVKEFVDQGETSSFDMEGQGQHGIFDMFSAAFINSGVGQTSTNIFIDSAHPLVSLLSRIVPSPDWFVGADSINLCNRDTWTDHRTLELRIWDAGTDKGLTFTAPSWAENPQRPINEITVSYPSLDASSFFYRGLDKLPTIARLTFTKLSEEEANYHMSETQRDWIQLKGEHYSGNSEAHERIESTEDKEAAMAKSKKVPPQMQGPRGEMSGSSHHMGAPAGGAGSKKEQSSSMEPISPNTEPVHQIQPARPGLVGRRGPTRPTTLTLNNDVIPLPTKKTRKGKLTDEEKKVKQEERARRKEEKRKRRLEMKKRKLEEKKKKQSKQTRMIADKWAKMSSDCIVSEWGEWSACSKTCGFGNRVRARTVTQAASGTGRRCPLLTEEVMCGSMRGCGWTHFSSNNWGSSRT